MSRGKGRVVEIYLVKPLQSGHISPQDMQITEVFYSLQGEGPWLGKPAVFIRLGGCLAPYCPWCDTAYAWSEFRDMTGDEVIQTVQSYPCRRVVITGGEPFRQWEEVQHLHSRLIDLGYAIQYETSGKAGIPDVQGALVVLSPKHIDGAWHIDPAHIARADYLKFVYHSPEAEETIVKFVMDNRIPVEKVSIMPAGSTRAALLEKMSPTFAFCLAQGFTMTTRLHILAFDGQRGV